MDIRIFICGVVVTVFAYFFCVHAEGVFVHWFEAPRIQDCPFLSLNKLLEKFDEHCVEQEGLGYFLSAHFVISFYEPLWAEILKNQTTETKHKQPQPASTPTAPSQRPKNVFFFPWGGGREGSQRGAAGRLV